MMVKPTRQKSPKTGASSAPEKPDVVVIGGPADLDYAAFGAVRVPCDYVGIMTAPALTDLRAVVYAPDDDVFGLPAIRKLSQYPGVEFPDKGAWRSPGLVLGSSSDNSDIGYLPNAIWKRLELAMTSTAGGLVLVSLVPRGMPSARGRLREAWWWISAWLDIKAEDEQNVGLAEDLPSHTVTCWLQKLTAHYTGTWPLSFTRAAPCYNEEPRKGKWRREDLLSKGGGYSDEDMENWSDVYEARRGHRNQQGEAKSVVYYHKAGGLILLPDVISVQRVLEVARLMVPGVSHPEATGDHDAALCLTGSRIKQGKHKALGWVVNYRCGADEKEVVMGHRAFLLLLAHVVSARRHEDGLKPRKPEIAGHSIETCYKPRKIGQEAKPSQQINDCFKKAGIEQRIVEAVPRGGSSSQPIRYRLVLRPESVDLIALRSSKDKDITSLLSLLPK